MALGIPFSTPWYLGAGSSVEEQGSKWPVSLNGFPYLLDDKDQKLRHSSVPLLRPAQDQTSEPGKQTLNPDAFFRRTFESWHVGAGQTHFDREDSSPWRFRRSKNINVWNKNQVSLLNATDAKTLTVTTNNYLAVAGTFLYTTSGTTLKYTQDITPGTPTFTNVTGVPGTGPVALASDGFNVLTAHAASGIYKTTRGAATTASHITGTVANVGYGKGRWIATGGASLYDITTQVAGAGPVALPAALFTHPNSDWSWTAIAEGPKALYVGGFSGDKSLIYRLTLKEDGTGLNQPVVAGDLPDGETVKALQGYLGFVLIGTTKGVRVGVPGADGELNIGAFIPTDDPVLCFEGQESFVWFGWSNFEGTDTGLGRIDLRTFSDVDALAPAYAADLMTTVTGDIQSVVTFQDLRVFTISNLGVYAEDPTNLAITGQIDSGLFDYGLLDEKLSLFVDMAHIHLGGSHSIYLSVDRGAFSLLATMTDEHDPIGTGEARAREFEIRLVLNRDGSTTTLGPTIRSWGLRSQPATQMTREIIAPLEIAPFVHSLDGEVVAVDVQAAFQNIVDLCGSKAIAQWREGTTGYSVIVTDYEANTFELYAAGQSNLASNMTCVVRMKEVV